MPDEPFDQRIGQHLGQTPTWWHRDRPARARVQAREWPAVEVSVRDVVVLNHTAGRVAVGPLRFLEAVLVAGVVQKERAWSVVREPRCPAAAFGPRAHRLIAGQHLQACPSRQRGAVALERDPQNRGGCQAVHVADVLAGLRDLDKREPGATGPDPPRPPPLVDGADRAVLEEPQLAAPLEPVGPKEGLQLIQLQNLGRGQVQPVRLVVYREVKRRVSSGWLIRARTGTPVEHAVRPMSRGTSLGATSVDAYQSGASGAQPPGTAPPPVSLGVQDGNCENATGPRARRPAYEVRRRPTDLIGIWQIGRALPI